MTYNVSNGTLSLYTTTVIVHAAKNWLDIYKPSVMMKLYYL